MRFPRLRAYLSRLPNGVDSYPEDVVKASTFRAALADKPIPLRAGEVPAPLERLVRDPPAVSEWVPEVRMVALFKMIGDHYFEERGGTDAFYEWVYEQNLALLGGALYRVLFWMVPPQTVIYGAERRWSAFRRGTKLQLVERGKGFARLEMHFKPHLLDQDSVVAIGTALRAIAHLGGARQHELELLSASPIRGEIELRWRR